MRRILSRNQVIDPVHPTRSAITVAGNVGVFSSSARTCGSNGVKLVALPARFLYVGGSGEASARSTVFFAQPTSAAIFLIDRPCLRRYLI